MDKTNNFDSVFITVIVLWIISIGVFILSIFDGNRFTSGLMAIIAVCFSLGILYMAFEKIKEIKGEINGKR